MTRYIMEVRDTGKVGEVLNKLMVQLKLVQNVDEANKLIRAGSVEINNTRVKDILFHVKPGNHEIKTKGRTAALRVVVL